MTTHRTPAEIAARVIARARAAYGSTPGFDYKIAVEGIDGYTELFNEVYAIANEHLAEVAPGADNQLDERMSNAVQLREQLRPELEAYAERCRARRYTGWSSSTEPIRYAS